MIILDVSILLDVNDTDQYKYINNKPSGCNNIRNVILNLYLLAKYIKVVKTTMKEYIELKIIFSVILLSKEQSIKASMLH